MKKLVGSLIFGGLVLTGCGNAADLEENWTEYIQEGAENLESYSSETVIGVKVALGPDLLTDEDEQSIDISIVGDLEKGYSVEENLEGLRQEIFFEGNDFYLLENDTWTHFPDSGPVEYAPWYPNIVDSLVELDHLIEASHSGDTLVLSYEGTGLEVFNAFEEEFSLSMGGVEEENVTITLEATMDDSTYYLQELSIDIMGQETIEDIEEDMEVGSVNIIVDVEYDDLDDVDLTDIEEDIANDVE